MKKRIVCILLAVLMIFSTFTAAFAEEIGEGATPDNSTTETPGGETPSTPDTPDTPDDPVTPDTPDDPVTPDTPDDPVTPETPDDPVTPDTPDDPVTPDTPDDPVTPDTPDDPVTPDTPDTPVTPNDPDNPVTPDDPVVEKEVITVTRHPQSQTVETGAEFVLTAGGTSSKGDVSYQWYYQRSGESTWRVPSAQGVNTNSLVMTADSSLANAVFRCKITGVEESVFTDTATIKLNSGIKILEQPEKEVLVQEGTKAELVVTASGSGLSYYWYYKEKGSTEWISTGIRSNSIAIANITEEMNGRVYRCKIYTSYDEIYSNEFTISVLPASPVITEQSETNHSLTVGEWLELYVKAEGEDLKYKWEYKLVDSSSWKSADSKKSTYSVEITDLTYDGAQFRCTITNEGGETISDIIKVNVSEAPVEECAPNTHIYSLWSVVSPATETISGLAERKCEICGKTASKAIPAGTPQDADLEEVLAEGYVPPVVEKDPPKEEKPFNWTLILIAGMALIAGGIIGLLIINNKDDDDDDDDEDDPTTEFVPVAEAEEITPATVEEEEFTKVIPVSEIISAEEADDVIEVTAEEILPEAVVETAEEFTPPAEAEIIEETKILPDLSEIITEEENTEE